MFHKKFVSNPTIQRQTEPIIAFPAPKNLQSNTYIIYEVLNQHKNKSPTKIIFDPQPLRKK